MSNDYKIQRGTAMAMRDGTTLIADLYLPDGEGPWPTLLQRLPYDRSSLMTQSIFGLEGIKALDAGFALVIQDTRGRYDSEGSFTPFVDEALDAVDTVAWVVDQDWSDGRVAMWGASYIGATQMLAATSAPKGLRAIAPQLTASEYYDGWTYSGGAFQLGFTLLWVIEALGGPDILRREDGAARDSALAIVGSLMKDPYAVFDRLPVDSDEIAEVAPYFRDWVRHDTRDEYWAAIEPSAHYGAMDVAGLHIAGWNDIFLQGNLRNYIGMRSGAATEWARDRQFLIVGPWSHGNPGDWQGDDWLGYPAAASVLNLTAIHLDFFRSVLDRSKPDMPRVQYFAGGVNEWRDAADWPVPAVSAQLFLGGDGSAASSSSGALSSNCPPDVVADEWTADPSHPVPTVGGASFLPGLMLAKNSGPKEQSAVETRPDVAVYSSGPLDEDVDVTGEVRLVLHATTDATDCDWVARLVDARPDGTTRSVVDGILRAKFRNGLSAPEAVAPGDVVEYDIVVGSTSHVFKAGHRIRLQVCSSNYPRFDRNPQQYMAVAQSTEADFRVARQRVLHGGEHASRLVLPVVSGSITPCGQPSSRHYEARP